MLLLQALRFELLLQLRTLRFRFGAVFCLAFAVLAPFGGYFLLRPHVSLAMGSGTYIDLMFDGLRFPTVVLAMVVAGNRCDLEGSREMWSVLSSSRVSNGLFLLYRCMAQGLLVVGLTLVPILSTWILLFRLDQPLTDPAGVFRQWALWVVPTAFLFVLIWSALTQITGTELGSLMLLLLGRWGINSFANFLHPWLGFKLELGVAWLGYRDFQQLFYRALWVLRSPGRTDFYEYYWSSDIPWSTARQWDQWLPASIFFFGIAALLFGVAVFYLRRTRSNLKPMIIGDDHPLRNMIKYVHGFRQRYSPDGGLYWERALLVIGVACLVGTIFYVREREQRFHAFATSQYQAQTRLDGFPPAPPTVQLADWRLAGHLGKKGLEIEASGRLRNRGEEPVDRLAFSLNPFLSVEAKLPGRSIEIRRSWDRLALQFEPALRPGEEVELGFLVAGRPLHPEYVLHGDRQDSFATRYRKMVKKAPGSERNHLARSFLDPLLSRRAISLVAEDLSPVLRYGTWELTPPPDTSLDRGSEVPEPASYPLLDLLVELRVGDGLHVADTCGFATTDGGRLASGCRQSLARYRLEGGIHRIVQDDGVLVAAALPGHEELLARQMDTVGEIVSLSAEVWDGIEPLDRLAIVEQPPGTRAFRNLLGNYERRSFKSYGKLLVLSERAVVDEAPLVAEFLVGGLMAAELLRRRSLEPAQERVFQRFFGAMMARRMSPEGTGDVAVLGGKAWQEREARQPVLDQEFYRRFVFEQKVPALLVYLESLVGARNLYAGVETFLSRPTKTPGTLAELIRDLEEVSGVSLDAYYDDYLAGNGLPKLRLEDVVSVAETGGRFRVAGLLRNVGSGEVRCPIVVKGETQVVRDHFTVATQSETPFVFDLDSTPLSVQLDPDDTCYRWVSKGRMIAERVSLAGES